MARYILLFNWTEQGVKNSKDTITRLTNARQAFEKAGAKLGECWWTMGAYDMVACVEAPDDETIAALTLATAKLGNVRTTTMRAFNETEMQRVLKKA